MTSRRIVTFAALLSFSGYVAPLLGDGGSDHLSELQQSAMKSGTSPVVHWGKDPAKYAAWSSHSNRLIPVYTFGTAGSPNGIDLNSYLGEHSVYRDEAKLRQLYGQIPSATLNPSAEYGDQTNVGELQQAAIEAGRKYIFLVVFDGMDWQTTQAAAIYKAGRVGYTSGRGTGLHFLDYTADGTTQFGSVVVAPTNENAAPNPDEQTVKTVDASIGGYNAELGGPNPWTPGSDPGYIIGTPADKQFRHAKPDSSGTATALTTGVKTYNLAINVDRTGQQLTTAAHLAQERGYAVGAVSSVPFNHATPAASYAHNVTRNDFHDLGRDMLGLPSVAHPERPLSGLDVVIGGGHGVNRETDALQGKNYVAGNQHITDADLKQIDAQNGGRYTVAVRTEGKNGNELLQAAAKDAVTKKTRLFGMFGVGKYAGHLPSQTANGDFDPVRGKLYDENYTPGDISENPTLADMTTAAIEVLSQNPRGFWLMVEPGDVDWANHDNNIDSSIGCVLSGDAAVKVITDWVEKHSNWQESLLIVTADHGHYLVIDQPEGLTPTGSSSSAAGN